MKSRGKLRVFGFTGFRPECPPEPNGSTQTREIIAAHSWAEVQRITEARMSDLRHSGCETGNEEEISVAMTEPGIVFWCPLGDSYRTQRRWRRG